VPSGGDGGGNGVGEEAQVVLGISLGVALVIVVSVVIAMRRHRASRQRDTAARFEAVFGLDDTVTWASTQNQLREHAARQLEWDDADVCGGQQRRTPPQRPSRDTFMVVGEAATDWTQGNDVDSTDDEAFEGFAEAAQVCDLKSLSSTSGSGSSSGSLFANLVRPPSSHSGGDDGCGASHTTPARSEINIHHFAQSDDPPPRSGDDAARPTTPTTWPSRPDPDPGGRGVYAEVGGVRPELLRNAAHGEAGAVSDGRRSLVREEPTHAECGDGSDDDTLELGVSSPARVAARGGVADQGHAVGWSPVLGAVNQHAAGSHAGPRGDAAEWSGTFGALHTHSQHHPGPEDWEGAGATEASSPHVHPAARPRVRGDAQTSVAGDPRDRATRLAVQRHTVWEREGHAGARDGYDYVDVSVQESDDGQDVSDGGSDYVDVLMHGGVGVHVAVHAGGVGEKERVDHGFGHPGGWGSTVGALAAHAGTGRERQAAGAGNVSGGGEASSDRQPAVHSNDGGGSGDEWGWGDVDATVADTVDHEAAQRGCAATDEFEEFFDGMNFFDVLAFRRAAAAESGAGGEPGVDRRAPA